ncbi:beta-ketoacyl synthase N-terminal-like domain-containing protein [Lentzea sp. BCCO 10_0798]|uniref:Beta-ketoacyl synthase N-terminal-like domain-containing protein n=1 Tax=Lentzea kristufekii TaxID=3095430 RepID=A0ABU4TS49_9PSEU|nr:beta-ketoacyl synthase N-terminal-like domain-containing protein [Lentzea sp. BCCO 10_0798]MDX8051110.1 beta-ketoacyl synthase N-terminal-like domain-containing protein [Lentzea sp. BCCO 10_0798]
MGGIAIVGIGAVFPGAPDAATFWRNIVSGVDAIGQIPPGRWDPATYYDQDSRTGDRFYCRKGGFVDDLAEFDPTRFGIMPSTVDGAEPDQLLALATAAEAIADAGGESVLPSRDRVGVVVGRGGYLTPGCARLDQRVRLADEVVSVVGDLFPNLAGAELNAVRQAIRDRLGPEQPESSIGLVPNLAASRIANRFDLKGTAYTVDAACASGLVAVEHAVRELQEGRADAMLAGAVHVCHHPTLWSVFTQLRALSPTERIRPFDANADGTLLSEGVGMVVLKRLEDVGDERVYAVIRGIGTASDGRATSMMTPNPDGQLLAVHRAWANAGLDPREKSPGLIEAHGTATPAGDAAELQTMINAFGGQGDEIGIGTVKSMIGHAMPAAGMAGLIKAALALHHNTLPPTLHVDTPHSSLAGTRFTPVTTAREWTGRHRAVVNAFGFGGINAHAVLDGHTIAKPRKPVMTFAADTADELAGALKERRTSSADRAFRLAIGNPDERKLKLAERVLAQGKAWPGRHDIWFSPQPLLTGTDQVVFLFPGFEREFSGEVVDHAVGLLQDGRREARELMALGITPGALAGHSMGEWTAMVVGGIYPTIDEFVSALGPGAVAVVDIAYAALGCSADTAEQYLVDGVTISHDNCPHQSVICGPVDRLEQVLGTLKANGVMAQLMPFRTGFHTPALAPYLGRAKEMLDQLPVRASDVPVWSANSLEPMSADDVRELVLRHLVEPVRFRPLLERLHGAGFRAFVQIGQGSLTGFAGDTLHDRPHIAVNADIAPEALWAFGLKRGTAHKVKLRLGTPKITLDALSTQPVLVADDSPMSAAVNKLLAHTNAVAREVVGALRPNEAGFTREFSLRTMPELVDHSVFPQAPGWPDLADGFPIVPATGLLEVFADAARRLTGGTVHGFAQVKAKRWLTALPATTVKISARAESRDRVFVKVGDYAEGVVLMSPQTPEPVGKELEGVREAPVTAAELYADNWMFHGPAFAGVTKIDCLADNGIVGVLTPLPAPGALLDSAGQLIGHWMQVCRTEDQTVLPTGIEGVTFHGPAPTGDVRCTAWIREVTAQVMVADAELTVNGALWCRITGWTTRRFTTDDRIWQVKLKPGTEMLSTQDGDRVLVVENWADSATRDLIMRRYLNSAERHHYGDLDVPAQRDWLLRVIAVKDAVRSWLWDRGAGPIYPAELSVTADGRVRGAFAVPRVEVTSEPGRAAARVRTEI